VSAILQKRLRAKIDHQQETTRYRSLENNSHPQGREIKISGATLVNFCSNDYLGLCNHADLKHAAIEAIGDNGIGAGAAALLSGRHSLHQQLEQELASFTGYECALLYSSGYLANIGLINAVVSRQDEVHHDKFNHASLIDAVKLSGAFHKRYRHSDLQHLEKNLSNSKAAQRWIITDSVFSMDGDVAQLESIASIAKRYDATLIIDDAHGFGVLGKGKGTHAHLGLSPEEVPIVVITLGKALGCAGAAVLGSKILIDYLIQSSRTFIYDTALPPLLAAAALTATKKIRSDPSLVNNLNNNIKFFRNLCSANNIPLSESDTPIQPLLLGKETRAREASEFLASRGIYVRAVRPPTVPVGTSRLRICISRSHTESDIEYLVTCLNEFLTND
jgi:8-amino-7-oxononanoate synthase